MNSHNNDCHCPSCMNEFEKWLKNKYHDKPMNALADNLPDKILTSLGNRGGFNDWWDNIDSGIQKEIKDEISKIISEHTGELPTKNDPITR